MAPPSFRERDWQRGGLPGVEPSPLTLRQPQLAAAEAALRAAHEKLEFQIEPMLMNWLFRQGHHLISSVKMP